VQVAALVGGHVPGSRSPTTGRSSSTSRKDAMRSQLWMLTVMVGFTSIGLWLLSEASK